MPCIHEHADRSEQFRPAGPDDEVEGPWFLIEPAQIRRLADIADDHDGQVKVEYRGAGYWRVYRLDSDGEELDDGQEIHAEEA